MKKKSILGALTLAFIAVGTAHAQPFEWLRQLGTTGEDIAYSLATDEAGTVYVAGSVEGALPGQQNDGTRDAFLRKLDAQGNELWTRQFRAGAADVARAVALGSGVYVGGATGAQAFLRKYDTFGNLQWEVMPDFDVVTDVDTEGDAVYVTGHSSRFLGGEDNDFEAFAFLAKYDTDGNLLWIRSPGAFESGTFDGPYWTSSFREFFALYVSARSDRVYMAGTTEELLTPGVDRRGWMNGFLIAFRPTGDELWRRQFGSGPDEEFNSRTVVRNMTSTLEFVFLVGLTDAPLPGCPLDEPVAGGCQHAGGFDAYLRRYDRDGNETGTRQFGTPRDDAATGVVLGRDLTGIIPKPLIVLSGWTEGEFAIRACQCCVSSIGEEERRRRRRTQTNEGSKDGFVRMLNLCDDRTLQFGSEGDDIPRDAARAPMSRFTRRLPIVVAGVTTGELGDDPYLGAEDAFVGYRPERPVETVRSEIDRRRGRRPGQRSSAFAGLSERLRRAPLSEAATRRLLGRLVTAKAELESGKPDQAVNALESFKTEVTVLFLKGQLPPPVGQALITSADRLIRRIR